LAEAAGAEDSKVGAGILFVAAVLLSHCPGVAPNFTHSPVAPVRGFLFALSTAKSLGFVVTACAGCDVAVGGGGTAVGAAVVGTECSSAREGRAAVLSSYKLGGGKATPGLSCAKFTPGSTANRADMISTWQEIGLSKRGMTFPLRALRNGAARN